MKCKIDKLLELYKENPCRIHTNAIWKLLKNISDFSFEIDDDSIRIYNDRAILMDYNRNDQSIDFSNYNFEKLKLALIHNTQITEELKSKFDTYEKFFRLIHNNNDNYILDNRYSIKNVNIEKDCKDISDFICKCYDYLKPSEETVISWKKEDVFKSDLWIWVIDKKNNKRVGLGIAEIDNVTGEGSLEWIQVLPEERGKGIGKIIVNKLLTRLSPISDFTTVSGKVSSLSPERLYRKCGFKGNDVWYVLRNK